MHHREFVKQLDEKSVTAAIQRAEQKSSAQLRVFVSHQHVDSPMEQARSRFAALGMHRTRQRNAVLIFIAPESRQFVIFGDTAVHEKAGDDFWEGIRDESVSLLKAGQFTTAIISAVEKVGERLAEYFPPDDKRVNELPDSIAQD